MTRTLIDEKHEFQAGIVKYLQENNGYEVRNSSRYDAVHAMDPKLLWNFMMETQPKAMEYFIKIFGGNDPQTALVAYVNQAIAQRSLIDVLKHGIELSKQHSLQLFFPKPNTTLNDKTVGLCQQNIFSVMEEVRISDRERVDLVIFLNGLAVMSFELKSNLSGQSYRHAIAQYRRDRDPKNRLFLFKSGCLVNFAMDLNEAYMCTRLQGETSVFLPFNRGRHSKPSAVSDTDQADGKKARKSKRLPTDTNLHLDDVLLGAGNDDDPYGDGDYPISYMWRDILTKESVLDLIGNFIFVEKIQVVDQKTGEVKAPKETMIFPRYHQFDAVRKLLADVRENHTERNYLIQHSAGSGKTNTIAWLAHRLSCLHDDANRAIFDSVLVVTDRVVVDRQLQSDIQRLHHQEGLIRVIDDKCTSADLQQALEKRIKIIGTTIQKFPFIVEEISALSDRHFAVIIDEAHSSTAGKNMGALTRSLASDIVVEEGDDPLEQAMALVNKTGKQDNFSMFAFTATPKPTTLQLFGTPDVAGYRKAFHLYSMRQAIEEGFILDVLQNYTEYATYYRINKEIEEDPKLQTAKAKRAIARFVTLHDVNISQRVEVIVRHFREFVMEELDGRAKAMVVTSSREEAVKYKKAVDEYLKRHGYTDMRALVAFSGTVKDPDDKEKEYSERGVNKFPESRLPEEFGKDMNRVLIVANKYQTGFDQPYLCAMYVLKKLRGVNAVQTLSRLNRIVPGKDKKTFVLDFVNTANDMVNAFAPYYTATILSNQIDKNSARELWSKVEGFGLFEAVEVDSLADVVLKDDGATEAEKKSVNQILNRIQRRFEELSEEKQKEFRMALNGFLKCYQFLIQATSLSDPQLHKNYLAADLIATKLKADDQGPGFDLKGKVSATNFVQKLKKETKNARQISQAIVTLAQAEGFILKEPEEKKLSEIIEEINQRFGKNFDSDVISKSILQVKDLLLKSEKLKQSAKVNKEPDFEFSFYDNVDQALIDGWAQNKDFFGMLLDERNEELKRRMLGIFVPEVYRQLKQSSESIRS